MPRLLQPEVDAASVKGWLEYGGHQNAAAAGLDSAVILAQTEALEADSAARARRLVDTFLDRVAVAPYQAFRS